jgi:hypothetical protein
MHALLAPSVIGGRGGHFGLVVTCVLQFVLGIIRERCDRDHSRAKDLGTTLSGELSTTGTSLCP